MPQFICCGFTFDGEQAHIEHRQKIHGEQPVVKHACCGIKFYTDEGFREHREKIHGEKEPAARRSWWDKLFGRRKP